MAQPKAAYRTEVLEKLKNGEYELIEASESKKKRKSDFWSLCKLIRNVSSQEETGFAQCKACHEVYKASEVTGSSSLKRHVKELCKNKVLGSESARPEPSSDTVKIFQDACVNYTVEDLRPFESFSDEGMLKLIQTAIDIGANHGKVDARKITPHPTTVSRALDKHATDAKQTIIPKLKYAIGRHGCAATTDTWTDDYKKIHYITMTIHFMNDHWQIESYALFTEEFEEDRATGDNIKTQLQKSLKNQYGISEEEFTKIEFVTDGGSNIVKALQDNSRRYCNAHGIHLTVKGCLSVKYCDIVANCLKADSEASFLIEACEEAVEFIKNHKQKSALKKKLKLGKSHTQSFVGMLSSVYSQFDEVKDFMLQNNEGFVLSGIEAEHIDELVEFLSPFDLDGNREKSPSVSSAMTQKLRDHCAVDIDDSSMLKSLKNTALEELSVMDLIKQIEICKELVTYLKTSGLQNLLPSSVKQEMDVRWNTILNMLKSIHPILPMIKGTIETSGGNLSKVQGIQAGCLEKLIKFLEPFEEESVKLQGEDYPTLPIAFLAYAKLLTHCSPKFSDSSVFQALRRKAYCLLNSKFEIHMQHKVATFLWPRYRKLRMCSTSEEKESVYVEVRRKLVEIEDGMDFDEQLDQREEAGPSSRKQSRLHSGYDEFSDVPDPEVYVDEVGRYLDADHGDDEDLLSWWRNNGRKYPRLARLAHRELSKPTTSASSERTFSDAGFVLSSRRTNLSPSSVNNIVFLHRFNVTQRKLKTREGF